MRIILNWLFSDFWRAGACAKVKYFFECYLEMCDRFGNQGHSLFWAKEKKFFNNSADQRLCESDIFGAVLLAPIIQWKNDDVKSFICDPLGTKCRLVWDAGGRGKQHLVYLNLLELCQQRRLYSEKTMMSSLFCDPDQLDAIWWGLCTEVVVQWWNSADYTTPPVQSQEINENCAKLCKSGLVSAGAR